MDWIRNLRVRQLRMLLRLAEVCNLSQVAKEFNLTQPALSKWLKDFEDTIGTELFIRHVRGLQPLPITLELTKQAREILVRLERVQRSINQIRNIANTQISIGVSPIATHTILPKAISLFHKNHPNTFIQLQENTLDKLLYQLQHGEIDVIVGRTEQEALLHQFHQYKLADIVLRLAVDMNHPLANEKSVSWEQALSYPWVAPAAESPIRQQMDLVFSRLGLSSPPVLIESSFVNLTSKLLENTTLIAPIASQIMAPLGLTHYLRIPDFNRELEASISLLWRPEDDETVLVQAFIESVKTTFI